MCDLKEIFQPKSSMDVILDTDVYNELDDYYAVAYLLGNSDRFNLKGITIAPFAPIYNKKVKDVAEGILVSERETYDLLKLTKFDGFDKIYRGGDFFLSDEHTPIKSDASDFIISASQGYTPDNRLYVIAIGAITNVASALLLDKTLKDRIAVVWLGGNAEFVAKNDEFNLIQDVPASRILFGTDVPLLQVPCQGVVSAFTTGYYELEHFLKGKSELCDYLFEKTVSTAREFTTLPTWSRVVWDVVAVASLLNDEGRYVIIDEQKRRLPTYEQGAYGEETQLSMLCVKHVWRDRLLYDMFLTLYECSKQKGVL